MLQKPIQHGSKEVSKKNFIKVATRFVNCCVNILTFPQLDAMRDTLIPEERAPAIQKAICGFIVHEVWTRQENSTMMAGQTKIIGVNMTKLSKIFVALCI